MKNFTRRICFITLLIFPCLTSLAQINFEHFNVSYSPEVFGNAAEFTGYGIRHNDYNTTLQYTLSGNYTVEFWIKVSPVFENEASSTSILEQEDGAINVYLGKSCNEQFIGPCQTIKPVIGFEVKSIQTDRGYFVQAEIPGYNEWFHVALVSNQSQYIGLPDDFYNADWDDYPGGVDQAVTDYYNNQVHDGEMGIYINGVKQKMIHDGSVYVMPIPPSEQIKKSTNPLVIGSDLIWLDDFRIWELPKTMEGIRAGINREEFLFGGSYANSSGLYAYFTYNTPSTEQGSGAGRTVPNMSRGAESPTNSSNEALAGTMFPNPYGIYPVFRSGHVYELVEAGNWGSPSVWKNFNGTFPSYSDDITINIQGDNSSDIVRLNGLGSAHSLLFKKGKIATNGGEFWCSRSTVGASATSYVITDKGLQEEVGPFVQSFWVLKDKFVSLPIGNATDYLPVEITGKTWDGFRTWAAVKEILPSGLGSSDKSLNVPWDIKTTFYGTSPKPGYQLKFQWNEHNEGSQFDRDHVYIANYHNGRWRQLGSGKPAEVISNGVFATIADVDEFSEFTAVGAAVPLPVTLITFNVQQEAGVAILSWATAMEERSSHFIVERSQDAKTWNPAGRVDAVGNHTEIRNYTFTDPLSRQLSNGNVYYRLKMIDQDQTFAYSAIRYVRLGGLVAQYTIYPNPILHGIVTVKNAKQEQVSSIKLLTMDGKNVADLQLGSDSTCKIPKVTPGTYLIEIKGIDGSRIAEKLLIVQ